jgi:hypothetical protein
MGMRIGMAIRRRRGIRMVIETRSGRRIIQEQGEK